MQYLSPGAAFLDAILSSFHSMVARPMHGKSSKVVNFWITPAVLSSQINSFCVCNALNFNLTAFPDHFSVIDHGGGVFSAGAASAAVADFILAHRRVRLGRSVYFLHRSVAEAAAAACLLSSGDQTPASLLTW
jgi:hypothetical protein